jgi:hypothetical protein
MDIGELLNIELYSADEGDTTFRFENVPGQTHRPNILEIKSILKLGLIIQADLVGIVYGHYKGDPATLLVTRFRFQSPPNDRRFRKASVENRFADKKDTEYDPEVLQIWPYDKVTLNQTVIKADSKLAFNVGLQSGGGPVGVTAGTNMERNKGVERADCGTVLGSITLEGDRNWGPKNVARFTLHENASQRDGVVSELRTAILLRRQTKKDHFLAYITVEAVVDLRYAIDMKAAKLLRTWPKVDPVEFDPGIDPAILKKAPFDVVFDKPEDKLEEYDLKELSRII